MLRVFVTGDNHIGRQYTRYEQRAALIEERLTAMRTMVETAEREGCALFVVTGDLFDKTDVAKRDVKAVAKALAAFSGTVAVLPGNHDFYDGDAAVWRYWADVTAEADNLVLLSERRPYTVSAGEAEVFLYPAPCTKKHSQENALGWIKEATLADGAYTLGIAHGAIEGLAIDSEGKYFLMTMDELEAIPVDAWLIGHMHVPFPRDLTEEMTSCGRVFNAGTHVQLDVACNTEGQAFIIEIDESKRVSACKCVPSTLRFYRKTVTVGANEMENDLRREVAGFGDNSVVELTLQGAVTAAEYERRHEVAKAVTARFLKAEVKTEGLAKLITKDLVDAEFPETSFSAALLTALLDEPKEAHLVYDLLNTLKEGH